MPSAPLVKTALVRKLAHFFWCVVAVSFVGSVVYLSSHGGRQRSCSIRVDNKCVQLERVSTPNDLSVGLSKYDYLSPNEGMLFVFDRPGPACMWMKDMRFSIDMVWLDEQNKVVKTMSNVGPETFPESFCSEVPARYVIELAAGTAKQANITHGQQINL